MARFWCKKGSDETLSVNDWIHPFAIQAGTRCHLIARAIRSAPGSTTISMRRLGLVGSKVRQVRRDIRTESIRFDDIARIRFVHGFIRQVDLGQVLLPTLGR